MSPRAPAESAARFGAPHAILGARCASSTPRALFSRKSTTAFRPLGAILQLIEWEKYFVLHAPRQTGKTSMLRALAEYLNARGQYRCLYINVESAQTARADVRAAIATVLDEVTKRARIMLGDDSLQALQDEILPHRSPNMALNLFLTSWAAAETKPLVLLVDEIDTMVGDSLISVLSQLRSGYDLRPTHYPQSVILCGVRDVRDYRIFSAEDQNYTTGGSAFNTKAESLRLGDFSKEEVRTLLAQHTEETGQEFHSRAMERIWELTLGQPWLVNALAHQACFKDRSGLDRSRAISETAIDKAKETLILNRVVHLDQLAARLAESRVGRVIEPMLAGGKPRHSRTDLKYVRDVGLVALKGPVRIANPIYAEVIPRELTEELQEEVEREVGPFLDSSGRLRITRLLGNFQEFYRENSQHCVELIDYKEAGSQLLLQAFLQGVINGGGRIGREYPLGHRRTDLLVQWPQGGHWDPGRVSKHVIELKALRAGRGLETTIEKGLRQTAEYMDRCKAESGHLLVFDRRPGKSWAERIFRKDERIGDTPVIVWGM